MDDIGSYLSIEKFSKDELGDSLVFLNSFVPVHAVIVRVCWDTCISKSSLVHYGLQRSLGAQ